MSQSSPGQTAHASASQQASSQALLDELRLAADRARDERLKLARLVKHSSELPVNNSAPASAPVAVSNAAAVPDAQIVHLTEQVARLEQAVSDKLAALDQAQRDINSRTQYLESLRHSITDTTQAFATQVEEAQHFKAHVDAAKKHVRMSAGRVVEDVRQQLIDLDQPINERVNQLSDLDKQIDRRIARMQQMHKQANEAVDKHLLGALRTAKEQAAELTEPVKQEIDKYLAQQRAKMEAGIHDKIAELDVDVEEVLKPLTQRFDEVVAAGELQAERFAQAMPERIEAEMNKQLDALRGQMEAKAKSIIDGVDAQTMEQAGRLIHEKIAKALDGYLAEAQDDAGGYVDGLITKLEEARVSAVSAYEVSLQEVESRYQIDREKTLADLSEQVKAVEAKADEHARNAFAAVDQAFAKLDERIGSAQQAIESRTGELQAAADRELDQVNEKIDAAHVAAEQRTMQVADSVDRAIGKLDAEVERAQAAAHERAQHARELVEAATDGLFKRAASAVDGAMKAANEKLDDHEAATVEHLRAIDDGIEHGIENSRKRLVEFERQSRKQGDDAVRIVEDGIGEARKKLAGFESGITQRISLATQTADEARGSIEDRLKKVEQDATRRIMQLIELSETSGNAIADSLEELARSADRTAERAQEDLDEKLRAFEHVSGEALRTAEDMLRNNIAELRDSSRAMIEMVSRQVKAQAGEIEPQTREVITQAEQTMRRRIAELRDAAQSMVDLTVNRLESQLEEVRSKAQQAAFEGVERQQGNEAA